MKTITTSRKELYDVPEETFEEICRTKHMDKTSNRSAAYSTGIDNFDTI